MSFQKSNDYNSKVINEIIINNYNLFINRNSINDSSSF